MYDNEKIYSIELGEDLEISDPPREQRAAPEVNRNRSRAAKTSIKARGDHESKPPHGWLQFAPLMALTYLLGPFSVHMNPANRQRKNLLTVGMVSGMAGLGMFAGWGFILDLIGKGWPFWPWAVIGAMVMVTGFSVWARAAYLAAIGQGVPRHQLPTLLRRPWAVGVLGLFAPGSGLLLAGCARRGAAVIWAGWPVVSAALLLGNGLRIWNRNQATGGESIPPAVLEVTFMIAAGILAVGLTGWVAQALEGARQMMGEPGIRHRMRGDWYAAALMCTLLGMVVVWDPAAMARHMGDGGIVLHEKGFRVIPLHLAKSAHRLDPGPTEYAVRVIDLYEELGRRDDAIRLRQELDVNLASYLSLVNSENRSQTPGPSAVRMPAQEWKVIAELLGQSEPYGSGRPPY